MGPRVGFPLTYERDPHPNPNPISLTLTLTLTQVDPRVGFPLTYERDGELYDADIRMEYVTVEGESAPRALPVVHTVHGPIISVCDAASEEGREGRAWDLNAVIDAQLKHMRAECEANQDKILSGAWYREALDKLVARRGTEAMEAKGLREQLEHEVRARWVSGIRVEGPAAEVAGDGDEGVGDGDA